VEQVARALLAGGRQRKREAVLHARLREPERRAGAVLPGAHVLQHDCREAEAQRRVQRLQHGHDDVVGLVPAGGAHLGDVLHAGQQQVARVLRLAARVATLVLFLARAQRRQQQHVGQAALVFRRRAARHGLQVHALQEARHFERDRLEQLVQLGRTEVQRSAVARQQRLRFRRVGRRGGPAHQARHVQAERRHLAHPFAAVDGQLERARLQRALGAHDDVRDLPFAQHGLGQGVEAAAEDHLRGLRRRVLAGGEEGLDLAVAVVLVRCHQQRAEILEQRADRRFLRALVKAVARHLAAHEARAQRRLQLHAHAVRMVAAGQRVDEQHRQRDRAHVVEAQQRDRTRHRRDGRAGSRAVADRVRQAQDALRERDVGQHVVREVVGPLVFRRGHLHDARDGAAEREHVLVAADLLQQRGAHAASAVRRLERRGIR
ncbi:conserved hypothetical protein, partial [Ricinus communis]